MHTNQLPDIEHEDVDEFISLHSSQTDRSGTERSSSLASAEDIDPQEVVMGPQLLIEASLQFGGPGFA